MPDAIELTKAIKKAALDAVEASKPVQVCFGSVKSAEPLKIFVDQKMILGENQLVLSQNLSGSTASAATGTITAYAESFVGKIPYLYGAGRNYNTLEEIVAAGGMCDCSAFTERVYRHFGAEIGSTCAEQQYSGTGVSRTDIQDGDLLILENGGHAGIYKEGGTVIHEGGEDYTGNVKTSPLSAFSITTIRRISVDTSGETSAGSGVSNGLTEGDEVILIRQQGGQKYIIVGKVL